MQPSTKISFSIHLTKFAIIRENSKFYCTNVQWNSQFHSVTAWRSSWLFYEKCEFLTWPLIFKILIINHFKAQILDHLRFYSMIDEIHDFIPWSLDETNSFYTFFFPFLTMIDEIYNFFPWQNDEICDIFLGN